MKLHVKKVPRGYKLRRATIRRTDQQDLRDQDLRRAYRDFVCMSEEERSAFNVWRSAKTEVRQHFTVPTASAAGRRRSTGPTRKIFLRMA